MKIVELLRIVNWFGRLVMILAGELIYALFYDNG